MTASFVTHHDALVLEVPNPRPNPGTGILNYYFGTRGSAAPGPQAFMVNFDPGIRNRAHFHHIEQFQVFFGTPGSTYQRHEIGPLLLHYADPDTVYGPFGAGPEPLSFLTLRAHGDNFIGFLPEDRTHLERGVRRHFEINLAEWLAAPLTFGVTRRDALLPEFGDGLAAWAITTPAGQPVDPPNGGDGGGTYYVIVEGEVLLKGQVLPPQTVGWCPAEVEPPDLVAGRAGVRLLALRFPATAQR